MNANPWTQPFGDLLWPVREAPPCSITARNKSQPDPGPAESQIGAAFSGATFWASRIRGTVVSSVEIRAAHGTYRNTTFCVPKYRGALRDRIGMVPAGEVNRAGNIQGARTADKPGPSAGLTQVRSRAELRRGRGEEARALPPFR